MKGELSLWARLAISVLCGVLTAVIFLLPKGIDHSGPDSFWRFGRDDPFRRAVFDQRGDIRPLVRMLLALALGVASVVIWLL